MNTSLAIIIIIAVIIAFGAGYLVRKLIAESKIASAEALARKISEEAQKDAEAKKREAILEAKEEILRQKNEMERENKERRSELQRLDRRLMQKEELLERKVEGVEKKEEALTRKESEVEALKKDLSTMYGKQVVELERISGLTSEEARQILLADIEKEIQHEAAVMIKEIENKAKEEGEKRAREIITSAIQRCAADHVAETTVAVIPLPNDEMKGRIIGREGRNIRAFETATGIDLIIDDTPEAVILSGFDPIRREVARISLEKLIVDGRIHPARIEEMVDKARKEVEQQIREAGEQAIFETGIHGLHPELINLLGRLKYRTSYGQNVLKHSIEVAHLAGLMAAELGVDIQLAKRAGLLHDIGKAVDHEVEGPHVTIGVELAQKYRENKDVIHAIAAHHGDEEPRTIVAGLVQAADAVSAARPGARRETLEAYIKRLQKLEEIASTFEGVEKSYAIQAGREIRIMVKPDKVDDLGAIKLVHEIVKKIENELDYPGQIKVIIIRETRVVDYAK
ncbi:ribonucrease Y [Desulfotomaculum arcticum]|uniref:Ribonuclease Y n=1 Tax=Desulfotruncus arcticus DSM 17038 TaxID=1121424 RepID=A0A1I2S6W6_9FIRM|nr:ribonuclease Y [Desulfotruncus arcticus]SFG48510.1 ribonucrease Y [Desulfotomaculum arcticum] [Desulfotruncus arcticus DSM 17038]